MRANLLHITQNALASNRYIPAITVYDFTTAQGVIAASEDHHRPVILLVPPVAAQGIKGRRHITALRGLADDAATPVCVQLDHATDLHLIGEACRAGVDSVLADGSKLPQEENAAFVRNTRAITGNKIIIEAELGALPGDEDKAAATSGHADASVFTNPEDVASFIVSSTADLLAVSVGNVHGHYIGKPLLDWVTIRAIEVAAHSTPLVLHGASGISRSDLQKAATAGIGKINFNTELRAQIFSALEQETSMARTEGLNLAAVIQAWADSAQTFTATLHQKHDQRFTGNYR